MGLGGGGGGVVVGGGVRALLRSATGCQIKRYALIRFKLMKY